MADGSRLPRSGSEAELAAICAALGARDVAGWSRGEQALLADARGSPAAATVAAYREAIRAGLDPLGEEFCALRSPASRRGRGATYTPRRIISSMIEWAAGAGEPARVIDPGAGSARFLVDAGRAFPRARLLGVEIDPLAAIMGRAHLAAAGLAERAELRASDYRSAVIEPIAGTTLFAGNPPYVRHHAIPRRWKAWLSRRARELGFAASQLAGLHVHFFLATLRHARTGDLAVFVTAAEWLDVNYGQLVRALLAGPLGLVRLDLIEPRARAFDDALTTAAISSCRIGELAPVVRLRRVASVGKLGRLAGGKPVARARLAAAARWTPLSLSRRPAARHLVELGELCAVHRGQVTGCNAVWIAGVGAPPVPAGFRLPTVTRARELFAAGSALVSAAHLRQVIDLPADLRSLSAAERARVEEFLRWARERGADRSYIASRRAPWWSVKLRAPAPILATYMARRPPAFVRNSAGVRHINIAHGLYPREPLDAACLDLLAAHLRASVSLSQGRSYAGGLTKFEPGEMERLLVPRLEELRQRAAELDSDARTVRHCRDRP